MQIDVESMDGVLRYSRFKHADVTRPNMNIDRLDDEDNDTLFQSRSGMINHVHTGEVVHFQRRHGVHVIKFRIKKKYSNLRWNTMSSVNHAYQIVKVFGLAWQDKMQPSLLSCESSMS